MKWVDIKLWDILGCFHYILNAPRKLPSTILYAGKEFHLKPCSEFGCGHVFGVLRISSFLRYNSYQILGTTQPDATSNGCKSKSFFKKTVDFDDKCMYN